MRKRSFPPVVDQQTTLLILGSLPGEPSLAAGRYYANPRNQFWALIGAVIGMDLAALPYEARLNALLGHGIGLWDSIAEASRIGSLDARIRDHAPNDLAALASTLPRLKAVAFNGGRSAAIGMKLLADHDQRPTLIALPSSSPAHARPLAEKLASWERLKQFIEIY